MPALGHRTAKATALAAGPGYAMRAARTALTGIGRSTSTDFPPRAAGTPGIAAEGEGVGYGLSWWAGKRPLTSRPDPGDSKAPGPWPPQPALRDQAGAPGFRPAATNCLLSRTRSPPPGFRCRFGAHRGRAPGGCSYLPPAPPSRASANAKFRLPGACSNSASIHPLTCQAAFAARSRQLFSGRPARGKPPPLIGRTEALPAARHESAIGKPGRPWPARAFSERPQASPYRAAHPPVTPNASRTWFRRQHQPLWLRKPGSAGEQALRRIKSGLE